MARKREMNIELNNYKKYYISLFRLTKMTTFGKIYKSNI